MTDHQSKSNAGNNTLAQWALVAVRSYGVISAGGVTDEGLATNLLASLRHLCDAQGWDFAKLDKAAYGTYRNEANEWGIATAALVECGQ